MYEVEDITESMNAQGDNGNWRSVIHNMVAYRVKVGDLEFTDYELYDQEMNRIEDDELVEKIINGVFYDAV